VYRVTLERNMCRTIYYKNSKTNISSKELELYKNKKKATTFRAAVALQKV